MSAGQDIRLLLSDVDGTLVTKDKRLTDAAKAAAQALRAAGIALAITTSRPARGARMLVGPLDLTTPVAGCNGGSLVNPDMSVIETRAVDPEAARQTVDMMLKAGVDVWVYDETDWYVRDAKAPHVEREAWILQYGPMIVPAFTDAHLQRSIKIVGVTDDDALLTQVGQAADDLLGDRASATRSAAYFLDVTNPDANKGFVVGTLAKRLGISPDQIATIGDMPNDVLMFRKSGLSIAMGNASDAVKAHATYVTDTNEADGFAKAVRQFILPLAAS